MPPPEGSSPAGSPHPVTEVTAPMDATAIIVNYNSGRRLGPLLDLVEPEVTDVVVVDNASTDGSVEPAEGRRHVRILRNRTNRGFAAATNQGAQGASTEWLLFVNPDVHLRPGDIRTLLSGVPADVAEVAPLQVDEHDTPKVETGGYQPSLFRYLGWALI